MWWHEPGWGPMYGWWIMPLFGLFCMVIFLMVVSRIFGKGGFCGNHHSANQGNVDELRRQIGKLRSEIKTLQADKNSKEDGQ